MQTSVSESSSPPLMTDLVDGVLTIVFNRPQARNALTRPMYDELETIFGDLPQRSDIKAVVLAGAGGKAFASGTDISELPALTQTERALEYEARGARLFGLIADSPVPTLAAVDGVCVGGGLAIAAAADLRIAAAGARFGMPIARTTGNCLSVASCRLLAGLVGAQKVKRLILTAELWSAAQAEQYGLVDEIVAEGVSPLLHAQAMARAMTTYAPLTLRAAKQALQLLRDGGSAEDERLMLESVYGSRDFAEGVAAFLEKRPPVWQGR